MPNYKGETTWEDELIDEGCVESIRNSAVQLLAHRGVGTPRQG
ncbi:hypothetical protein [Actinoplanes utahensis]|nr:hypothetical protein [Actinoplanes utahensis]